MDLLGLTYSKDRSTFRVHAQSGAPIRLALYKNANIIDREVFMMDAKHDHLHSVTLEGDYAGYYYTYLVDENEVTDPYSIALSQNGIRSAIIDLKQTDPLGFRNQKPLTHKHTQSVIYELHVKDFTYAIKDSKAPGTYLGLVEHDLFVDGLSVGIDHLVELGITHVHLMPVYDFATVNEDKAHFDDDKNYNWGYDPRHFNTPEGSYSSQPDDPTNRIFELKTLIMKCHEKNIGVILDVVYNHTYFTKQSNFNILMPNSYYRMIDSIYFANGSGCGNEFASESVLGRQFIVDSVLFWAKEYQVDGFRFDLVGLIDKDTMYTLVDKLHEINPYMLIYGEPWTAADTPLPYFKRTLKDSQRNQGFALFNDTFRDAIKGDNDSDKIGFTQGDRHKNNIIKLGLFGSLSSHFSDGFTENASETINYVNAHDNLILQDKLEISMPNKDHEHYIRMNKLTLATMFFAQGIPFIHAGNEFMRTKQFDHNSYNSGIKLNAIDWTLKKKNSELFHFTQDLIHLKRNYSEFSLDQRTDIEASIKFIETSSHHPFVAYTITSEENSSYLLVIINASNERQVLSQSTINRHIATYYQLNPFTSHLDKVFGMRGFIKVQVQRWDPDKIITRPKSVAIWRVSIDK